MAVMLLAVLATSLAGQRPPPGLREVRDQGSGGISIIVAQPLGAFRRHGDYAGGLTLFAVAGGGALGLRVDGAYLIYDSEYQGYGVSTTSSIGTLALGPQITVGSGPLRLYGFATGGASLFWSSGSYDGGCSCYDSDLFYLDGDFTTTASLGTGLLITVSSRRTPIAIDLGVRETYHDRVKYVPAGGLTDNGDGTFTARRVETPVTLRVFHLGVSIGIR